MPDIYKLFGHSKDMAGATPSLTLDPSLVQYKIYWDLSEIRRLSQQWDDLLVTSQCNRVFASLEWYLASCRMDTSGTPYVVAAFRGAEMAGILPLLLDRTAGLAKFPDYGSDYNDVLVQGDNSALAADLLKYAVSADTFCRHLKLIKLRPDSTCLAALQLLKHDPGIEFRCRETRTYFYAQLPSTFEEYLASLGKIFRKGIRRALRAATAAGLTICELEPHNIDALTLSDIFISLLLCRHRDMKISEQLAAQSFVREVLPPLFQKGSLRACAVIEEGCVIAVELICVARKGFLAWNGGFLTGKEHWSPGNCLDAFAIRQAIAEGLHEFDYGSGDEAYKHHWTNGAYRVNEVELISKY